MTASSQYVNVSTAAAVARPRLAVQHPEVRIRRACVSGELPATRTGDARSSRWLIKVDDLAAWIATQPIGIAEAQDRIGAVA